MREGMRNFADMATLRVFEDKGEKSRTSARRAKSGSGPPKLENSPDCFFLNVGSPGRLSAIVDSSNNLCPS
ncbi:hypothetical protein PRIPAC_92985 [Pristionchus pacificus]|uniref:Uncharacterized protein n=1 Tax=Pristionchus pacificus TaxID=54126 RepID=A0A2A6BAJ7_PRIPA|nr:hypothetical protein PRIPAC_92985 [Pristionchus pacificus]|eukprot:PDM62887.1 hypothetical protein PRIPAC_50102 [Pristionchus pacificus]